MNYRQSVNTKFLPSQSFVRVRTKKLKKPVIIWSKEEECLSDLTDNGVYCLPQENESQCLYEDQTARTEVVDVYGGAGTGTAGGSGRCSIYRGLQTKGVGRTPLVSPDADVYHSSGRMTIEEACQEAIFSEVYGLCLPFGAVKTIAVISTGAKFFESSLDNITMERHRALVLRPFVLRPAHFLRNIHFSPAVITQESKAAGLTADAYRVSQAMPNLRNALVDSLSLTTGNECDAEVVFLGLQELARRYAQQIAASFAKRLPHGALSCSNVALNGAYIDFGVSSYVADYRRQARPPEWADSWTEKNALLRTLGLLWMQYLPFQGIINSSAGHSGIRILHQNFEFHLKNRLKIEMVKMIGLPEDMVADLPKHLSESLFIEMKKVWMRGECEQFVSFAACPENRSSNPPPQRKGRYKLNEILSALADAETAADIGRILVAKIDDAVLRYSFGNSFIGLIEWLKHRFGEKKFLALRRYMKLQALRKNMPLNGLSRAKLQADLRNLEVNDESDIRKYIDEAVNAASYVLADLHPFIPGASGFEQVELLEKGFVL